MHEMVTSDSRTNERMLIASDSVLVSVHRVYQLAVKLAVSAAAATKREWDNKFGPVIIALDSAHFLPSERPDDHLIGKTKDS